MGLAGNPIEEKQSAEGTWRDNVSAKLKKLKKLDGKDPTSAGTINIKHAPTD